MEALRLCAALAANEAEDDETNEEGAAISTSDVAFLYAGACRAFPRSAELQAARGAHLHQIAGDHLGAAAAFERALELSRRNPSFGGGGGGGGDFGADEALQNLRSFAAERWHFRMLNDRQRNARYDAAIQRALARPSPPSSSSSSSSSSRGDAHGRAGAAGGGHWERDGHFVDHGGEAGAAEVVAVESNAALCALAEKIEALNGHAVRRLVAPPKPPGEVSVPVAVPASSLDRLARAREGAPPMEGGGMSSSAR